MKRQIFFITSLMILITSTVAANPLLPKRLQESKTSNNQGHSKQAYVNFTGHWVGSCNGDDEKETLTIEQDSSSSSIKMDNVEFPIDALSINGTNESFNTERNINHLRWSQDGQQLLVTHLFYSKEGYMSHGDFRINVGHSEWFIDNNKLNINYSFTFFSDGYLKSTDQVIHCVYEKA